MITQIGNLHIRDDFSVTISGTIVAFRDDDEFLLQDSTGQVRVDSEASDQASPYGLWMSGKSRRYWSAILH